MTPDNEPALPRVKLLTMPATLTAIGSHSLDLATYRLPPKPALTPRQLTERVPELARFAQVEPDQDWGIPDMQAPTAKLWIQAAERLQQIFDHESGVAGAVVVHGTNQLEEIAYFLNLVLKTDRPVVVVGAQRPFTALSSDGPMNVVAGVRVAASQAARDRGVLVVLNEQIHAARDVTKTSTYGLEAFQSTGLGPIGRLDAGGVCFYYRPERLHTHQTRLRLEALGELPRVEIIYDHAGADGGMVEAAVQLGARGLVVAGSGAGAIIGMRQAVLRAAADGIVVVRSSRVGSGRVLATDHHAFPGGVAADDLNPQKARVLLQLGLTLTRDPAKLQALFDTH